MTDDTRSPRQPLMRNHVQRYVRDFDTQHAQRALSASWGERLARDWLRLEKENRRLRDSAKIASDLLNEVMTAHRWPDDAQYNECEKDPCMFCIQAAEATKGFAP